MRKILLSMTVLVLAPFIANAEGVVAFTSPGGSIYSAGESITVSEHPPNDIVAAGGSVVISGSAGNDVLAAGGTVVLSGKTPGDARIAGGNITITDEIGGEAVVAGGRISLAPQSSIGKGLIAAAGEITIEGTIDEGARIIGEEVFINGTVIRDLDIKAQRLVIGKNAVVKGDLRYASPQEARIEQGAVISGEKIFTRSGLAQPRERFIKFLQALWLAKLLAVITAALVISLAFAEKTEEVTGLALNRFGRELLAGFIVFVTVPAAALLLLITVAGALLGLLIAFFFVAFILLASVFGALVFTRLISGYLFRRGPPFPWTLILLGVFLYQVVGLIPFLGWIMKFIFFLSALGALSQIGYRPFREKPAPGG